MHYSDSAPRLRDLPFFSFVGKWTYTVEVGYERYGRGNGNGFFISGGNT